MTGTPDPGTPRERDVLDDIDEQVARITPEHIEARLQETLRRAAAATAAEAIDPGKLDLLADWLDLDDKRKGRSGPPEVQADLRRWAQLVREERLRRLSPDSGGEREEPGYWQARAALTTAVHALVMIAAGTNAELAASARDTLGKVDAIMATDAPDVSASRGHDPGCGCRDCCADACDEQDANGPVYGGGA